MKFNEWQTTDTAPINTIILVYGSAGVRIGVKDDLGNWRGRHGGTVKQAPTHWMPLPEVPV